MPKRKDVLIGIDCSAQATKICAWTFDGKLVGQSAEAVPLTHPEQGWAEQNPLNWWRSTRSAFQQLWEQVEPKRVAAIGLATQRDTFALQDARGNFIRPAMTTMDVRASEEVEEIASAIGREEYHALTGKPLDVSSALARLLWLRRHEPDVLPKVDKWVDVSSVLAQHLTGNSATCLVGVDSCGLISLTERKWLGSFIDAAGLRTRQLPDLVDSGTVIGKVRRQAARQCGLPEGVPVIAAGGDEQVFSVGMAGLEPAELSLTLGTQIVLGVASPEPLISPLFRTLLAPGDGYLLETILPSGTYLLRWFVETFNADSERNEAYWDKQIRSLPPGADGLVTVPNWWGMRGPEQLPEARGVTLGWSPHHTQAHFYRSLIEGLSFELKRTVNELRKLFPQDISGPIRAGGGGSHSSIWCPIIADVLNIPLRRNRVQEATTLGAAVLAGVGSGVFPDISTGCKSMVRLSRVHSPKPKRAQVYQDLYNDVYAPVLDATTAIFMHHHN